MSQSMKEWKIKPNDKVQRIDLFLQSSTNETRSYLQKLIKEGFVFVNGNIVKPNYIIKLNDHIVINEPTKTNYTLKPVNLDLEIVYEDEFFAVINKPKNLIVHPSDSFQETTLINGLLYQFEQLSNQNEPYRQGFVHRLDKDTTGLMIICKDDITHEKLKRMFQNRKIEKFYLAIAYHEFKELSGQINQAIIRHPKWRQQMTTSPSGRTAITKYKVINQNNGFAYLELNLITGRTHQIRVHLKAINHPILGDPIYGPKKVYKNNGPYLHAHRLVFNHPITKKKLDISIEPPIEFMEELIIRQLV